MISPNYQCIYFAEISYTIVGIKNLKFDSFVEFQQWNELEEDTTYIHRSSHQPMNSDGRSNMYNEYIIKS